MVRVSNEQERDATSTTETKMGRRVAGIFQKRGRSFLVLNLNTTRVGGGEVLRSSSLNEFKNILAISNRNGIRCVLMSSIFVMDDNSIEYFFFFF